MAWDSVGHRLVAQVAYDQLTPEKQKRVDQLISVLAPYYPNSDTFVKAATWADNLRFHDVSAFNPWHYIAIPYSTDGSELIPPDPVNIVWAIENATKALKSKRANKLEKAIFLRFLIHFLADIHQPLHCADLYSKKFPEGDKGGNLFRIDNKEFHQLHAFWDASLGEYSKRRLLTGRQIKRIAAKLEKKYPIKEGEIFASEDYSKAKDKLYEVAERRGYIKARWEEHTVLIDEENHSAKIKLNLDTGARYYFGPITFEESRLHPDFLQRYVRFKEGAPYSTSQLIELQESLNQSAYFQRVSIHPQRKKVKDSRIPINIQLVPRKSRLYTFGIGFGTDTGARTSFSWEKTPANQYGHKMQALARLSQVQQNIVARYSIPGRDPAHSQYLLSASYYTNEVRRGDHETEELSAAYISHFGKWEQNASVRVLSERFDLDGQSRETTQIIIPGIHWTRTNADDLINTSEGSRISFGIRGGYSLSSNSQYFQSDIKAKYIHSLTDNDRIILRGELGHTIVHNLEGMPLSQRFFAGGAQNLRGFGYQNLGPGRYLTVASAEYQHRLWGELYGVLFYDVGNAFNHFFDERLREGIGFGFLYRSPVGPLQLTLAWAISEPDYHHKRLEFAMGPDFQ